MKQKKAMTNILVVGLFVVGTLFILTLLGVLKIPGLYISGYSQVPQLQAVLNDQGKLVYCDNADPYYKAYLQNEGAYKAQCYKDASKVSISCEPIGFRYVKKTKTISDCGQEFRAPSDSEPFASDATACQPGEWLFGSTVCGWVTNSGGCLNNPKIWGFDATKYGAVIGETRKVLASSVYAENSVTNCPAMHANGMATTTSVPAGVTTTTAIPGQTTTTVQGSATTTTPQTTQPDSSNFLTRIWDWIKSIFGG